jgi:predicted transposase/invertase (TIGR01784 family)
MKDLLNPKLDLVFKIMFEMVPEALADLISSVLKLSGNRRIRHVKIKNPVVNPDEEIKQKFVILDILAEDRKGRRYDIEMQMSRYEFYPKRSLFYVCRLYTKQLMSGKDYGKLMPVIGIHFLDYTEYPEYDDFHFCFGLREKDHPELVLTEDMELHLIELPKFEEKTGKKLKLRNRLEEWAHFFNHAHEEKEAAMRTHYTNPMVRRAFTALETLSAEEKNRILAQKREESLMNERYELAAARRKGWKDGRKDGKKEGREEEKKEIAASMLKDGMTAELIAKYTGLSADKIRRLNRG